MTKPKPKRIRPKGASAADNRIMRKRNTDWLKEHTTYGDPDTLVSALRNGKVKLVFPDSGTKEKEQ